MQGPELFSYDVIVAASSVEALGYGSTQAHAVVVRLVPDSLELAQSFQVALDARIKSLADVKLTTADDSVVSFLLLACD